MEASIIFSPVLIDYATVFGATLALVACLEFATKSGRGQWSAAGFFACVFFYLGIAALEPIYSSGILPDFWFTLSLVSYTFTGPLGWLYIRALFDLEFEIEGRALAVLLAPTLFACLAGMNFWFTADGFDPGFDALNILSWVSFAINMFFFGLIGWYLANLRPAPGNRALWIQTLVLLGLILGVVVLDIFQSYVAGALATVGLLFYGRLLGLLRPGMRETLESEAVQQKYRNSKLEGMDLAALKVHLERLMEEESYYAREDLSLAALAADMDLSSHQLSELINLGYGKGFRALVNEYRVRAAREMLLRDPERDVTDIAYTAGFQSLSSFYRSFKELYHMSPNEFRKTAV